MKVEMTALTSQSRTNAYVGGVSDLNFKSMTRLSLGILQRLTKLNVKQAA